MHRTEVVLVSAFRNSTSYIKRYCKQARELQGILQGVPFKVLAVEGDSTDGTRTALKNEAKRTGLPLDIMVHEHGGPVWGSVETPERFNALSRLGDAWLEAVQDRDCIVVYVESDLTWLPSDIARLTTMAYEERDGFNIFAPMCWAGEHFYDVWGFRGMDGARFAPFAPYHSGHPMEQKLYEVSTAGSCVAFDVRWATARMGQECLVGFCKDARGLGAKIAVATELSVRQL